MAINDVSKEFAQSRRELAGGLVISRRDRSKRRDAPTTPRQQAKIACEKPCQVVSLSAVRGTPQGNIELMFEDRDS
jgi:hypothetical protein